MKTNILALLTLFYVFYAFSQTPGVSTYYQQTNGDSRQYIEYIPGNLPIIISAPHGGVKQSGQTIGGTFYPDNDSTLPDRNCGTNERDDNTEILVREIQEEIFALTGCYAHVIINNLHRSKLDPNRSQTEATCGNANAADHWNAFHNFIDQASTSVETNWGKGLYIDLHGQSHSIPRIELGYNISNSELNNANLNASNITNKSTIRNLITSNLGGLSHEALVRGNESLGAKLKGTAGTFYNANVNSGCNVSSGYRAIPSNFDSGASNSCDDTRPFSNSYFDGDFYNNRRHGSGPAAADGIGGSGDIDGIMSEVNRRVRDLGTYKGNVYDSRPQTLLPFAKDYAAVLLDYIDTHYNDFANFNYPLVVYNTSDSDPIPNVTGITGGTFSSTSGLSINTSTGDIDVSNSTIGTYTITYQVGTCGYYTNSQIIQIIDNIPDTEAPIAPTNLIASNTTQTTTSLSWTAASDNVGVSGYDIYQDSNNIASTTNSNFNVTGLVANTDYSFYIIAKDSAGNVSDASTVLTITTNATVINYCSSASTNVNDEFISSVQLNTIDNNSGAQFYSDFTNLSTILTKNSQYTVTITPTWTSQTYNEAYSVWIDYNRDGDFEDVGEQVFTQGNTQATSVSGSFIIPSTALENTTRMRISMKYNAIPTSCETFQYGEVEDYEVNIQGLGPDTTAPIMTLVGASSINLNIGNIYSEQGATASDDLDGDITANIIVGGDTVNTIIAGTYLVTYNVSDAAGNSATPLTRTVNVLQDTTAPIMTLVGASSINLNIGDIYSEQGATASDDLDGDITANIIVGGDTVNTIIAGTYLVTYNVNDAAGNPATPLTRTIIISAPGSGCSGGITSFPYLEGFENTLGGWTQSVSDDINWTVDNNGTPSNNTGPSSAIQGDYYVYVEASTPNFPSRRAILNSPCFDLSTLNDAKFSFNYHMFGASDMGRIDLEVSEDAGVTWTSLWNETENKGNSWQIAIVDLSAYIGGGIQLRFNRFVGSTWQADIAIDNVSLVDEEITISNCSGGITNYPYAESYENTLGAWTQSTNDDINWTIDSNGTPSNNTGPSSAITGSFYIFVEASGNGSGFPNKQAIINSPCYDLSQASSATFSFNYHMFGSNDMGTIALDVSNDNGMSWTSIWTESGNKGNTWLSASIDLSGYTGNSVQLRFNRITGGTWQADIAIDNIGLTIAIATAKNNSNSKVLNTTSGSTLNSFKLYPNPVSNILNIKYLKNVKLIFRIINALGQTVKTGETTKKIHVDNLDAGLYFIEVNDGKTKIIERFIKN